MHNVDKINISSRNSGTCGIKDLLFSQLDHTTQLIVPNRRTARVLTHDYNQYQAKQAHWRAPCIMSLETWLQQHTIELLPAPWQLLTSEHDQHIWHQTIESQTKGAMPHQTRRTIVKMAQSAWALLHDWCIDLHQISHIQQEDIVFFHRCAEAFDHTCQQNRWLTLAQRGCFLREHTSQLSALLPSELILYGFDHLTPNIKHVFDDLKTTTKVTLFEYSNTPAHAKKIACQNSKDEMNRMLAWAKQSIQHQENQRIICIVPQLNNTRANLARMIKQHFSAPEMTTNEASITVNISSGEASSNYPIIQHALQLIALAFEHQATPSTISALLRSPYITGSHQELAQRQLLDQICRNKPHLLGISSYQAIAQKHHCPLFATLCHTLTVAQPRNVKPSVWAVAFTSALQRAGWPGERNLNSEEHQLCKALHTLFDTLASFDNIHATMPFKDAYQTFSGLCQDHLFQSQSTHAQIEILGTLEGSSIPCDQIWVMDVTDQTWPAKANPHPFLPNDLQQAHNMPHANAAKELAFSQAIMKRLSHNCQQIYFSYACHDGEQTCSPSPLLAELPAIDLDRPAHDNKQNADQPLHHYQDQKAPNIEQPSILKSAGQLLQHQANCPFQAFGIHRLHAQDIIENEKHIHAADKGTLIHIALDRFWDTTKDQQQLTALSEQCLAHSIDQSITQAFKLYTHKTHRRIHHNLQDILQQNIHQLMQQWLILEKKRPFFRVIAQEQEIQRHLAGIPIQLRPDRIDQLADGSYILIDYKTGQANHQDWLSDRLTQPQLPLYAVTYPLSLDGIAFAHVKMHQCQYRGLINHTEGLPSLSAFETLHPDTPETAKQQLFRRWQQQLEQLANEFLRGLVTVSPHHPQSCRYCHLSPVCRVQASQ